jgi:hypothetical protein
MFKFLRPKDRKATPPPVLRFKDGLAAFQYASVTVTVTLTVYQIDSYQLRSYGDDSYGDSLPNRLWREAAASYGDSLLSYGDQLR